MTTKQELLERAGVKDWREMSRLLTRAQGKLGRGEVLTEAEQRVWEVASAVPPGARSFA